MHLDILFSCNICDSAEKCDVLIRHSVRTHISAPQIQPHSGAVCSRCLCIRCCIKDKVRTTAASRADDRLKIETHPFLDPGDQLRVIIQIFKSPFLCFQDICYLPCNLLGKCKILCIQCIDQLIKRHGCVFLLDRKRSTKLSGVIAEHSGNDQHNKYCCHDRKHHNQPVQKQSPFQTDPPVFGMFLYVFYLSSKHIQKPPPSCIRNHHWLNVISNWSSAFHTGGSGSSAMVSKYLFRNISRFSRISCSKSVSSFR